MDNYICTMCFYTCKQHKDFCYHIVRVHRNDPRFIVFCQFGNCEFSTKRWNSYKTHIYRFHKNVPGEENTLNDHDDGDENTDLEEGELQQTVTHDPRIFNAAYLLSLETQHNLSQTAVTTVAETTSALIKFYLDLFKSKVQTEIQTRGCQAVNEIINEQTLDCSFDHLLSEHRREQFYEQELKMISPQQVLLGYHLKTTKGAVKRIRDIGYIVPFKDLLKCLYSLPEFLFWVEHDHESKDDFIRDIGDGDYVRNHPLFQRNKNALQIILYNDDLEIVNPLGTHVKKHKVSVFYVTFANVPPEHRSKLPAIFPIAIVESKVIRRHGLYKLLEDLIQTVNIMSSGGIPIEAMGKHFNVEGVIVMAPADTPAANCLGGFKEGVGFAYKKCRTCLISAREMKSNFRDEMFRERTATEYIENCNTLDSGLSREARAYWSKMWGINQKSCLCKLSDFHVIHCLVHDPMHVLLEGVVKYEMALFLTHCIENEKYFTLNWLNAQLEAFPYSYLAENRKPEPIQRKHYFVEVSVKQTAAAMLTLISVLPFILAPKVPRDDAKWVTFLTLIQITFMSINPCVTKETSQDLRNLTENHHEQFVKEYPRASITPKMHFMCHMPEQIKQFGPGRCQWCMRFEAKHAFFKNKKWRCFKNLALSMFKFHQKWLCGQMMTSLGQLSENFFYSGDEVEEGNAVIIAEMIPGHKRCVQNRFPDAEGIFCTKQVKIHGLKYREGCILVCSYDENHIPRFGYVVSILIENQTKYFLLQSAEIVDFHGHILSYQLQFREEFSVVGYHDLTIKFPLELHLFDGKLCVMNKYACISMDLT